MSWGRGSGELAPDAAPPWLKPLTDNCRDVKRAYRRRVPPEVLALVTAANTKAAITGEKRDAAVLVLFSGPADAPAGGLPDDADLLVTVRASTLRHHAGQAAFPGGAADPGDDGPVSTALREANEETGIDTSRLQPLCTLERMFIPPSGFHVVPVLAYSQILGRWASSTNQKPRSSRGYRCARSSTRRTGSWCTARRIRADSPARRSCSTRCWCGGSPAR